MVAHVLNLLANNGKYWLKVVQFIMLLNGSYWLILVHNRQQCLI